jgi:hypothetical protein
MLLSIAGHSGIACHGITRGWVPVWFELFYALKVKLNVCCKTYDIIKLYYFYDFNNLYSIQSFSSKWQFCNAKYLFPFTQNDKRNYPRQSKCWCQIIYGNMMSWLTTFYLASAGASLESYIYVYMLSQFSSWSRIEKYG